MSTDTKSNITNLPTVASPRMMAPIDIFSDAGRFEHAQRVAKIFAASSLVPPHMQNVANVMIALDIANRLGEQALAVMQNIYVVSGRPGWKTEYVIARANRAGVFSSRITWEVTGAGDGLSVKAMANLAGTGELVDATCDMKMAKAEGWTRNAKYTSMPEHMLKWRSAAFLIRLYAPEVMLGVSLVEELETAPAMRDVTPASTAAVQSMRDALDDFAGSKPAIGNELDEYFDEATTAAGGEIPAGGDVNDADAEAKAQAAAEAEVRAAEAAAKEAADKEAEQVAAAEKKAADARKTAEAKAAAKAANTAKVAVVPKTAEQYIDALKLHVDAATYPAALKAWFLSKEQKDLRTACAVTGADMDTAKNHTLAKIAALAPKSGA
jgi:hypothetical protein